MVELLNAPTDLPDDLAPVPWESITTADRPLSHEKILIFPYGKYNIHPDEDGYDASEVFSVYASVIHETINQLDLELTRAYRVPLGIPAQGLNTIARVCMAVQKRAARVSANGPKRTCHHV